MTTIFDAKGNESADRITISAIIEEIQTLYRNDSRPWVIGYSGGKDSTCALQLIWEALVG